MSSLQESSKPHRGEAHENNLLRLFKIDAPRHRINIFGGTISRDTRQSNRDQAKHKPASAQGNRAVTSGGEQNMNGVANKQGQPVTSALGTGPDQSENDEISRSASLEVSQGPITNAPETHTESAGPSRSPTSQAPFTAPPPINPHNLTQQAPHQQSAISNTDGLFFALPTMKMSSHDVYQCSQIEGRLRDAITHKFVPKKGLDPFYSLGSMMVKPKGHSPKAMIVLTCCNRENMKRLKRIVKSLQNFDIEQEGPMSKYKVLVHVGERPDQPAGGNVISSSSHMVYAFIGENVATLSGVLAHTENHSEGGLKKFTIGGTIVVDGVPYALAVAHPFQRQHVEDPPEDSGDGGNDLSRLESDRSEDESSNADGSDYYHSLLASFGPDDNTEDLQSSPTTTGMPASDYFSLKGKQSSNDNIKTEDPDQSTVVQIGVVHLLSEPRSSVQNLERSSTKDPDYALIRLHPTQHSKPNLVTLPEERIPKEITGFLSNIDKATSADVWVNAGMSGIQKGWLTQVLYREEEILWLPQRGLSGRELHVSYLLRSVAREDSNQKVSNWSILPTAVYHSFDLRTGRSFWLTTKYDDLFSRRATGMRDSTMDREKGPTRNGKIPACLRAALATHLVYLAWSGENWREFTNDHELLIRKSLLLPRTIEKQPSVGTWSRLKAALNLIRGSAMQHRENADIDDGEWNRALYETSRRIKWALLTIRQDCGTIAQVSEFYIDLTSGAFQSSAQECQDIIDDFASQTKAILKDLETRYVELEYLGKEIDEARSTTAIYNAKKRVD
ncbi:hypothetical protein VM1G_03663 [Cytospora mali]|uniref:CorA-like transporter domain-containing protein n=1 Tax=Cytospora mali TaxID=578113 RepID=A0A194VW36_CYTMA|nr:hypothetical protein VM1G_03663 [Valsa mali]